MADGPAIQIRDLLSRWADAQVAPRDVLADLDRRGWRSIVNPSLVIADPGWGREQGYSLLVAFGDNGLAGFTAYLPAGFPDDPVPSAVTVGTEAQRLWGDGNRLGPGWLAWPTPHGRCEMRQAEVTVVSWLHAGTGAPTADG